VFHWLNQLTNYRNTYIREYASPVTCLLQFTIHQEVMTLTSFMLRDLVIPSSEIAAVHVCVEGTATRRSDDPSHSMEVLWLDDKSQTDI
jgi:hypothetical protein